MLNKTWARRWCVLAFAVAALPLHAAPPAADDFARQAQQLLEQTYAANAPGAVVLVARGDQVLVRAARGTTETEAGRPLTPNDRFHIGSLTKQMVAAGVLKLVEAGKVSLDDPLSKYVPGVPNGERIVLAQLLNHTSGIRGFPDMAQTPPGALPQQASTDDLINAFKNQAPAFEPGERFAYNDSGYILLGKVIEIASGKPWHEYLAEALFRPLGMRDTGYGTGPTIVPGYAQREGRVRRVAPNISWEHACGALVSTVDDMLKWNRALHEGRVLAPATYRQLVTPRGPAGNYAFGIDHGPLNGHEQLSHSGSVVGHAAHLLYLPGSGLTVAMLRNRNDGQEYQAMSKLARQLALIALGEPAP